jgi:hypothetical protein
LRSPDRPSLAKALRLTPRERAGAVRAVGWLIIAGIAVRLLPFATIARAIRRIPPSRSRRAPLTPEECGDAIRRAASVWRLARCLPQAVAGYCMLRRSGLHPALRLGARLDGERRLDAHAWLECDGVTVTGGGVPGDYAPLVPAGRTLP